jgi:nicotinamidase-related amidase
MKTQEAEFFVYLQRWLADLPEAEASRVFARPEKTAILSVDMTNAFTREGNLASPRVAGIIPPVVRLFETAWSQGVRQMVLLQDCHTPEAEEFGAFALHAVCGTSEAEAVDEIKALPFYDQMEIIPKNSINPAQATGFNEWLERHSLVDTFIVVGDCTDICVYQLATHLLTWANARDLEWRMIVPEDCVQTYDLPLETANQIGAKPHPGDLMHQVFLYHMALNGIEIVRSVK